MKIFITGSSSFIGKELIKLCDIKNVEIIGVDLLESDRKDCFVCDLNENKITDLIPEEADAVIHLAGLTRDNDCKNNALNCFNSNVIGTLNLIEASEKKKVKQFIFASSEWVYDSFTNNEIKNEYSQINPINLSSEYALSKYVSELNLKQKFNHNFCDTSILRFGITYGARLQNWSAVESIFNTVALKDEVSVGSLKTGRNFIFVRDLCNGIFASIGLSGFNILNIQGSSFVSLGDIINNSKAILNKEIKVFETSSDTPNIRKVEPIKAQKVLNWKPTITLDKGLKELGNFLNYI